MTLKENRSFSLMELVITFAIVSVLGLSLWSIITLAFDTWRSNSLRRMLVQEARVAMEQVIREARNGVWTRNYNNFYFGDATRLAWDAGSNQAMEILEFEDTEFRLSAGTNDLIKEVKISGVFATNTYLLADNIGGLTYRYLGTTGNVIPPTVGHQGSNNAKDTRMIEVEITLSSGGETYKTRSKAFLPMVGVPRDQGT